MNSTWEYFIHSTKISFTHFGDTLRRCLEADELMSAWLENQFRSRRGRGRGQNKGCGKGRAGGRGTSSGHQYRPAAWLQLNPEKKKERSRNNHWSGSMSRYTTCCFGFNGISTKADQWSAGRGFIESSVFFCRWVLIASANAYGICGCCDLVWDECNSFHRTDTYLCMVSQSILLPSHHLGVHQSFFQKDVAFLPSHHVGVKSIHIQ